MADAGALAVGLPRKLVNRVCYQVNLQRSLGGGEVFTRFFSRALASLGWRCTLFVSRGAAFWDRLKPPVGEIIEIEDESELCTRLPNTEALLITHGSLSEPLARALSERHVLAGFAHLPFFEREPGGFVHYRLLVAVSGYVLQSAHAKGLGNLHAEPVYGVADLAPRGGATPIIARSPYDWDKKKFRDRALHWVERAAPRLFASGEALRRESRTTLGIVSRLTPIKQFPALFHIVSRILARHPHIRLEIFGSGGYASVRDLRRALKPCARQVRFWGLQEDVASVYRNVDYVISGLPEKEALGLNLIEAQASGTPVLAVRKPPFIETVREGVTGFLFRDPREDEGMEFESVLTRISNPALRPDPLQAKAFLDQFSETAFRGRVERILHSLQALMNPDGNQEEPGGKTRWGTS